MQGPQSLPNHRDTLSATGRGQGPFLVQILLAGTCEDVLRSNRPAHTRVKGIISYNTLLPGTVQPP